MIAFHFLAGLVTGAIFAVPTLLVLVALALIECVGMTVISGVSVGIWSLGSLFALQVGYLGGIYIRSVLESAGIAARSIRSRRHS